MEQYSKNIAFTRLLKIEGRQREFNFRRKFISGNAVYEIDVSDEYGIRHYLSARQVDGTWTVDEKQIPSWMKDVSANLHDTIIAAETGS